MASNKNFINIRQALTGLVLKMKSKQFIASITLMSLVLLGAFLAFASAAETFTVPNFSVHTVTLDLNQGDSVTGSVSVSGGTGNDINLIIQEPDGNIVATYSHITSSSFSFTASQKGTYKIIFDNTFSLLTSKSVTVDYSVNSPSSTLVIAVVAVIIIVVVIAAIVVMKKRAKAGTSPSTYQVPPPPPPA
jgi:hypothetical protein